VLAPIRYNVGQCAMLGEDVDRNMQARSWASMLQKVGMNSAILVRRHTTTKIVSWPSERGSPLIKSMEIESHGY